MIRINSLSFYFFLILFIFSCQKEKTVRGDLLQQRKVNIGSSLDLPIPVLRLTEKMNSLQLEAQELALKDEDFTLYLFEKNTNNPYRSEIFASIPLKKSDQSGDLQVCGTLECFRIEMYNYALNLSSVAVVAPKAGRMISVRHFQDTQPDLPEHLVNLALEIAVNSQEVQDLLGFSPHETDAIMERTKTALNETRCEQSRHLCVAPTFVVEPKALWAIVDLTDHELVGTRWTNVGETGLSITERRLQNDDISTNYCDKVNALKKNNWDLEYILTSSDGLEIKNVRYKGKDILRSAKLVDWHVSYSETDGFGYSDGVGCPYFSSAAVVAVEPPFTEPILEMNDTLGFRLIQKFWSEGWPAPCNYNYQQKFEFYNDGSFRIAAANLGRGCGDDATYRPVTRIAFAGEQNNFHENTADGWKQWTTEQWKLQSDETHYTDDGYQYKIENKHSTYYVEPGNGQFDDGGKGDNAWVYVTKHTPGKDEGESDLLTIGPCCNTNYEQGPEKFMKPEAEQIQNSSLILWYVAQIRNNKEDGNQYCWAESYVENGTYKHKEYPCFSGPKFTPINLN